MQTFILTSRANPLRSRFQPEVVKRSYVPLQSITLNIVTFWTSNVGKYLEEIIPNECKMSDRKRSRKHHEDRHEKKKHKESKQDEGKYQHQTRKLIQEVQKLKHVETL